MGIKVQPTADHHYHTGYSAATTGKETRWSVDGGYYFEKSRTHTSVFNETGTANLTNSSSRSHEDAVLLTDRENLISQSTGSSISTVERRDSEFDSRAFNFFSTMFSQFSTTATSVADFSRSTGSSEKQGTSFFSRSASHQGEIGTSSKVTETNGVTHECSTSFEKIYESTGSYQTRLITQEGKKGFTNKRRIFPDGEPSRFDVLIITDSSIRNITEEATYASVREGSDVVRNTTMNFISRGERRRAGNNSDYPETVIDYDSDDPRNGPGEAHTYHQSIPTSHQQSKLGTYTQRFYVPFSNTRTTQADLVYTIPTVFNAGESSTSTTKTTIKRTVRSTADVGDRYKTVTFEGYEYETFEEPAYFKDLQLTMTITGPAAYLSGGQILSNEDFFNILGNPIGGGFLETQALVHGTLGTMKSFCLTDHDFDTISYSTDASSGGEFGNTPTTTTDFEEGSYSDFDTPMTSTTDVTVQTTTTTDYNGKEFNFGSTGTATIGIETTVGSISKFIDKNTDPYNYMATTQLSTLQIFEAKDWQGTYRSIIETEYTFVDGLTFTTYSTTINAYKSGPHQRLFMQNFDFVDGELTLESREPDPENTRSSAESRTLVIESFFTDRASVHGRYIVASNADYIGEAYYADKDSKYGGYQYETTDANAISDAARKYRTVSIGDQIITTTTYTNKNLKNSVTERTINSFDTNSYASSYALPLDLCLKLNKYYTFLPTGHYGNFYTNLATTKYTDGGMIATVSDSNVSFEYYEDDVSLVKYTYTSEYTTTGGKSNTNGTTTITGTKSLYSSLNGKVQVGLGAKFDGGTKTKYYVGNPRFQLGGYAIGGQVFTDQQGFSVIGGFPYDSYMFDSSGSTLIEGSSESVADSWQKTVSIQPNAMMFRNRTTLVKATRPETSYGIARFGAYQRQKNAFKSSNTAVFFDDFDDYNYIYD